MSILHPHARHYAYEVSTDVAQDWRDSAACLAVDPELFFPIGKTGPALLQIDEAKAVCAECPVLSECRERHMDETSGVWGGMSEDERRAARRAARRAERAGVAA